MKKLLIILFIFVGCLAFSQTEIFYNSTPGVACTPPGNAPDGSDFLPGDTLEYNVYVYPVSLVLPEDVDISELDHKAVHIVSDPAASFLSGEVSIIISLLPRIRYWVAIAVTHLDGGLNRTDYNNVLYSSRGGDTQSGLPFLYIPLSEEPLPDTGPTGLRDSGI